MVCYSSRRATSETSSSATSSFLFWEDFMEKTFPRWLRHSAGTSHLLGIGQQLAQHHIWGVLSSPGGSQT